MFIKVTKKHIKLGQPKCRRDPLSLAFQEATGLSDYQIEAGRTGLTLHDGKGGVVYHCKYPEEVIEWNRKYWGHCLYGMPRKMPKPMSFRIGEIRREMGPYYYKDILEWLSYRIEHWYLGEYELLELISQEKSEKSKKKK